MRSTVAALVLGLVIAGCSAVPGSPSAAEHPRLGVSNGTTLSVTLVVNGRTVGTIDPGGPEPSFDAASLPDVPWSVEARSPSGRLLTSMTVKPGDVWSTARPGGAVESSGAYARVDLSCGTLRIWAGDVLPSGPVPPSPAGSPGDCAP